MEPIQLIKQIGQSLTIVHYVPGRVRLRFSKDSLPLIKQFSEFDTFQQVSLDQFIDSLDGITNVKSNPVVGSATIQFNPKTWQKTMWEHFCQGVDDPKLNTIFTNAINQLSN